MCCCVSLQMDGWQGTPSPPGSSMFSGPSVRQPEPPTAAGNLRQSNGKVCSTGSAQHGRTYDLTQSSSHFSDALFSNVMDGCQDDETLEWCPDEIGALLPHEPDSGEIPEEALSEGDSKDNYVDFEGLN